MNKFTGKKYSGKELLLGIRDGREFNRYQMLKLAWYLSVPAILAQLTYILMEYIDASMVGSLGANASASIGLVASTTWLFGGVSRAMVAGYSIQLAHAVGAKLYGEAKRILKQSFIVVLSIAAVIGIAGALISSVLPVWLGGSSEIIRDASLYFLVYALSLPVVALNSLCSSMLQCSGNMKVPGILNSSMCILDILLNFIFIFPDIDIKIPITGIFFELPGAGLGVLGAAVGTALSQLIIACVMLYFLLVKTPVLRFERGICYKFSKEYMIRAFKLALPIAFERLVVCGAMIVTTRIVAPLGVISIAANSFGVTAESICYMPGHGISEASTTLIGQSIGAGRRKLAFSFGKITISLGMILMLLSGVFMFFAAPFMMGLLSNNPQVCQLGTKILKIESFAEMLYGASIVAEGVLRGAGDTLIPSIMNFVSLWCVRIPLSYILSVKYGLVGVWIAMSIELCFRGIIFLIRFLNCKKF